MSRLDVRTCLKGGKHMGKYIKVRLLKRIRGRLYMANSSVRITSKG